MAKVLLGTPSREVLDLVTATLESLNHAVQSSTSSFDFLTVAEEESPEIFVLDDDLGPQPLSEILGLLPAADDDTPIPVILLTASTGPLESDMMNMGVMAAVDKHLDSKEWVEELTRLLGERAVSE